MNSFCAMTLQDVVLDRARQRVPVRATLLGQRQVHAKIIDAGLLIVSTWDCAQVDAVEQNLHIVERRPRSRRTCRLAERQLVVGIAAHQRRQIEGHAQSRPPASRRRR